MPRGGARPGAGKRKGVPNKANAERLARCQASGETPFDALIEAMRYHLKRARDAVKVESHKEAADEYAHSSRNAKDAAPYVHARLAAVEHSGADGSPIKIVIAGSDSALL